MHFASSPTVSGPPSLRLKTVTDEGVKAFGNALACRFVAWMDS